MIIRTVVGSLATLALAPALHAFDLGQVDIHGFVSQGYLVSNGNDYLSPQSTSGTFEYNEVGINFGTNVTDDLRIGVQLFSRDLGDWSNNELIVDWAFGDQYIIDEFSIRAGKIKAPKGLYQEIQDFDFLRVWTFLPTSVYDPSFRVFASSLYGAQAYGNFDLGAAGGLSYSVSVGDQEISTSRDLANQALTPELDKLEDANLDVAANIHLEYDTPLEGLRLVATYLHTEGLDATLSGTTYNPPVFGVTPIPIVAELDYDRYAQLTVGAEYSWRQWTFSGEYSRIFNKFTTTVTAFPGLPLEQVDAENSGTRHFSSDGAYLGVGFRLDEHWSFGGYLSSYWSDTGDRSGDDQEKDYMAWRREASLSVRYDINQFWLIKAEAHFANGVAGLASYNEDGDDLEENWQFYALKTTFNF